MTAQPVLRRYRAEDFEAFSAHLADAQAMVYLGVHDRRNAWRVFGCNMGEWLLKGAGWWAIEHRESGALVGNVGAFYRDGCRDLEIGWNTFRPHWGMGFATEAATEVVRHAFDERKEPRVIALIGAPNIASRRVADHLGMVYDGEADFYGKTIGRYSRTRDTKRT